MRVASHAFIFFLLLPIAAAAINPFSHEDTMTTTSNSQAPKLPPEVVAYLKEAPPESRQFDFLIGNWDVSATRYKDDGSILMQYKATWHAHYLNDGRMIMDDFKALAPTGQEVSSIVTLRTYAEVTHRWEMVGLAARQPAWNAEWYGQWTNGEMQLDAIGKNLAGITIKNKIRFFHIAENNFDWESELSLDGGNSWSKSAALHATRREN